MDNGYRYGQPETCFPIDTAAQYTLEQEGRKITPEEKAVLINAFSDNINITPEEVSLLDAIFGTLL